MTDFAKGFHAGIMEAARTLREAAADHVQQCTASKKVVESQGHQFAAAILASWANGLEINANRSIGEVQQDALRVAAESALRFLMNQDGAGFGTTKMEGSEFYMWASTIANDLRAALPEISRLNEQVRG